MRRIKTFIIFLLLILLWSLFFGAFKLYFWTILSTSIHPSLETIAGYLSFGGIFAYMIGGALTEVFHKRSLIIFCALSSSILLALLMFFGSNSFLVFIPLVMGIGFFYSLWAVIKNILISVEIHRTGYSDSVITGVANITFIIFVIAGIVLGPILASTMGTLGSLILGIILIFTMFLAIFLDYDNHWHLQDIREEGVFAFLFKKKQTVHSIIKRSFPEVKNTIKRYGIIILAITLLWAITTIVSQKSVEISKEIFLKSESQSSLLLLYSSVGAIFGNIISMALQKRRWLFFSISNGIFAVLILAFPSVIQYSLKTDTYEAMIALAIALGVFFGSASNLLEGYYFKRIYDDNDKEYGSAAYGFSLSVILTVMMLASSILTVKFGHNLVLYAVGVLVVGIG